MCVLHGPQTENVNAEVRWLSRYLSQASVPFSGSSKADGGSGEQADIKKVVSPSLDNPVRHVRINQQCFLSLLCAFYLQKLFKAPLGMFFGVQYIHYIT